MIPHARFINYDTHEVVGTPTLVEAFSNTGFEWHTPPYTANKKCVLQISFNGENWQDILTEDSDDEFTFKYYSSPKLTSIEPRYGPVKKQNLATIKGSDFQCPDVACANLLVRFGTEEFGVVVPGKLVSSS